MRPTDRTFPTLIRSLKGLRAVDSLDGAANHFATQAIDMEPSSSNKGFFQEPPSLPNQFHDDVSFQRAMKRAPSVLAVPYSCRRLIVVVFLPQHVREQVSPEIERVGEEVLQDRIFQWIVDAERNKPYLKGSGRDAFGRPTSELVTGEGWRKLQEFGIGKGYSSIAVDSARGHCKLTAS